MKRLIVLVLIIIVGLSGCVTTTQSVQKSNLTAGMAKTKIVKGQTTQNDILEVFGAPNIVTKNKSGNEVWTYDKVSVEKSSSDGYGTILVAGISNNKYSSSARAFVLMIEFDDNDIVKEYSYRSSAF